MALPTLTPEQRQAALDKAGVARQIRAEVKNRLRHSGATVGEVISESASDPMVAKLKVIDLLQAMPGIGKVKAKETMDRLRIAESRRLRGLGTKQVRALIHEFDRPDSGSPGSSSPDSGSRA